MTTTVDVMSHPVGVSSLVGAKKNTTALAVSWKTGWPCHLRLSSVNVSVDRS
jgi:hypothetical protein